MEHSIGFVGSLLCHMVFRLFGLEVRKYVRGRSVFLQTKTAQGHGKGYGLRLAWEAACCLLPRAGAGKQLFKFDD